MSSQKPSAFAPADRAGRQALAESYQQVTGMANLCQLLDAVPNMMIVINGQRQIVYANKALCKFLGYADIRSILGTRPGELLGCTHASNNTGGCGTTRYCAECGAIQTVLKAMNTGQEVDEDCHLTRADGDAIDLHVWSSPLVAGGQQYQLLTVADVTDEHRRRALERIFFHDVLNTAGGLQGYAALFPEATEQEKQEFADVLQHLSTRLVNEIMAQKELTAAEAHELIVEPIRCQAVTFLQELKEIFYRHESARDRQLRCHDTGVQPVLCTDITLLGRVVGNMVKNALEATPPGGVVTIQVTEQADDRVCFAVHNDAVIPENIQLNIFKRSYSTKGANRGLGTYSMRLLGERYLKGKVRFTSSESDGTWFYLELPKDLPGSVQQII